MHPLEHFFWPRGVAVIGASPDPHRIRGLLLAHLRNNGFAGRIVPVNPSYREIDGLACHPSLAAAGEGVDLAAIAVPAGAVPAALEDCAAAGVPFAVIITSGFAEQGGGADQAALRRPGGPRLAGPNCEGFYNAPGNLAVTFSPTVEVRGPAGGLGTKRLGVIAQSGGIGFSLFQRARAAGLGISYAISTGNEADLTAADFLDYMIADPRTDAVLMFCEAIRDPDRFRAAAAAARAAGKPIIAIKVGTSEAGRRAAASHTAALSGAETAYRAVFAAHGVMQVADPAAAVALAGLVLTAPPPRGRRVGVITVSGGGGAWMADTLVANGLELPTLPAAVQDAIRAYTPSYAAPANPVDTTAQGANTGPMLMRTVALLEACDALDSLVLVSSFASETRSTLDPAVLGPIVARGRKPLAVWSYTEPSGFGRASAAACGVFLHTDLRALGEALGRYTAWAEARGQPRIPATPLPPRPWPGGPGRVLTEHRVKALLAAYGLPAAPDRLARTAEEAVAAAAALGYPVALKIQSPDIPHKTEAGGVRLNLADAGAVRAAFPAILRAAAAHAPAAAIEGVLVSRMAPAGVELAIGCVNDATFGPILMLGLGGTGIELFGDVAHHPAPVSPETAAAMLRGLTAARLLGGFRGAPPVPTAEVAALASLISRIAVAHRDRIAELEFNPVIVHADGGVSIADALALLR
ncbi:MAG: acetate--CoA ligase family protein [Acetobacteraceae bacterium]